MWVENGTAGVSYVINRGGVEDAGLSRRSSKLIWVCLFGCLELHISSSCSDGDGVLWLNSCDAEIWRGVYGWFDGEVCFVKLIDVDIMVNGLGAGTSICSAVCGVNGLVERVHLFNKFSCKALTMNTSVRVSSIGNKGVYSSFSRKVAYTVVVERMWWGELIIEIRVRASWRFCFRSAWVWRSREILVCRL